MGFLASCLPVLLHESAHCGGLREVASVADGGDYGMNAW